MAGFISGQYGGFLKPICRLDRGRLDKQFTIRNHRMLFEGATRRGIVFVWRHTALPSGTNHYVYAFAYNEYMSASTFA